MEDRAERHNKKGRLPFWNAVMQNPAFLCNSKNETDAPCGEACLIFCREGFAIAPAKKTGKAQARAALNP